MIKKGKHVGRPKKLTFDSPEEEIKYSKDQIEYQKQEIEFPKKARSTGKEISKVPVQERFRIIYKMSLKGKLDIQYMCKLACVSRSGYYAYVKRLKNPSLKELQDEFDYQMIKKAYEYKSRNKGAKQIKIHIERDYGVVLNLKKIRRLMKKYNLACPNFKFNG